MKYRPDGREDRIRTLADVIEAHGAAQPGTAQQLPEETEHVIEAEMDEDQTAWIHRNFLPSDYSHGYDEATTTLVGDDEDEPAYERIHQLRDVRVGEVAESVEVEFPRDHFSGDEETGE